MVIVDDIYYTVTITLLSIPHALGVHVIVLSAAAGEAQAALTAASHEGMIGPSARGSSYVWVGTKHWAFSGGTSLPSCALGSPPATDPALACVLEGVIATGRAGLDVLNNSLFAALSSSWHAQYLANNSATFNVPRPSLAAAVRYDSMWWVAVALDAYVSTLTYCAEPAVNASVWSRIASNTTSSSCVHNTAIWPSFQEENCCILARASAFAVAKPIDRSSLPPNAHSQVDGVYDPATVLQRILAGQKYSGISGNVSVWNSRALSANDVPIVNFHRGSFRVVGVVSACSTSAALDLEGVAPVNCGPLALRHAQPIVWPGPTSSVPSGTAPLTTTLSFTSRSYILIICLIAGNNNCKHTSACSRASARGTCMLHCNCHVHSLFAFVYFRCCSNSSSTIMIKLTPSCTYACMFAFAGFLLCYAIFLLAFNNVYHLHPAIRLSSYRINNISLVGSVLSLVFVLTYSIRDTDIIDANDGYRSSFSCMADVWLFTTSFTLLFGGLGAKMYRVHVIFNSSNLHARGVSDPELVMIILAFLSIDVVVCSVWSAYDPLLLVPSHSPPIYLSDGSAISYATKSCISESASAFVSFLVVFKAVELLLGAWLSFKVRNVPIKELNDSKWVAISIYSIIMNFLVCVPILFYSRLSAESVYVIVQAILLFTVFALLSLNFLPKVLVVWWGTNRIAPATALPAPAELEASTPRQAPHQLQDLANKPSVLMTTAAHAVPGTAPALSKKPSQSHSQSSAVAVHVASPTSAGALSSLRRELTYSHLRESFGDLSNAFASAAQVVRTPFALSPDPRQSLTLRLESHNLAEDIERCPYALAQNPRRISRSSPSQAEPPGGGMAMPRDRASPGTLLFGCVDTKRSSGGMQFDSKRSSGHIDESSILSLSASRLSVTGSLVAQKDRRRVSNFGHLRDITNLSAAGCGADTPDRDADHSHTNNTSTTTDGSVFASVPPTTRARGWDRPEKLESISVSALASSSIAHTRTEPACVTICMRADLKLATPADAVTALAPGAGASASDFAHDVREMTSEGKPAAASLAIAGGVDFVAPAYALDSGTLITASLQKGFRSDRSRSRRMTFRNTEAVGAEVACHVCRYILEA